MARKALQNAVAQHPKAVGALFTSAVALSQVQSTLAVWGCGSLGP
ncbi:DUF7503 family protein [Halospeciosus flavus]|uniref:Uncharacterized protein n=1 Tax=Halospeciosus flavus TaxID=3032283 RepID=A0ABD5Z2D1_9EURY|nr:hypothetical protein [Halospeciosus flavus]